MPKYELKSPYTITACVKRADTTSGGQRWCEKSQKYYLQAGDVIEGSPIPDANAIQVDGIDSVNLNSGAVPINKVRQAASDKQATELSQRTSIPARSGFSSLLSGKVLLVVAGIAILYYFIKR